MARMALAEARIDRRAAPRAFSRATVVCSKRRWNWSPREARFMTRRIVLQADRRSEPGSSRRTVRRPKSLDIELVRPVDDHVYVLVDDLHAAFPQEVLVEQLSPEILWDGVARPVPVPVP